MNKVTKTAKGNNTAGRARKGTTERKLRGDWAKALAALIKAKGDTRAHGSSKGVSKATADKRWKVLFAGFRKLRELGYKVERPESFAGRHMQALVDAWVAEGLSASSIQNRVSVFRTFGEWIGKKGMIEASVNYVTDPSKVSRHSVATEDKSWTPRGFSAADIIAKVRDYDVRVGTAMELQLAFGLRVRESLLIRPHLADLGGVLDVYRGGKNDRRRVLRIETDYQRLALARAKAVVQAEIESVAGPASVRTWEQARNHYHYVMDKFGVCRKEGITSHGLRHENANEYFAKVAGYRSPVQGGPVPTDSAKEKSARIKLAEHLGHSRESVTTYYAGRAKAACKKSKLKQ
jgi:site-specific recombinase XerC